MKKAFMLALSCALSGTFLLSATACSEKVDYEASAFEDPSVTLSADLSDDLTDISETLFGVFLEDINYASYALDDNLIINGSFESTQNVSKTYGWDAENATLTVEDTAGVLSAVDGYKDSSVNKYYAKVDVAAAGGKIENTGYPAIPIAMEKGTEYVFTAFIKAENGGSLSVGVEDDKGNKSLSASVSLDKSGDWIKYTRKIKATETATENLKLVFSFGEAGTYYVDAVSLETTNATGGIKQYFYDAIKNLSPSFIRFPGGCITEGNGAFNKNGATSLDDTAYDWKNSIGAAVTADGDDIVPAFSYKLNEKDGATKDSGDTYGESSVRKPNRDLWGGTSTTTYYDMEYGVGFYEYFLLCDSLGASAVPVLNCGYSCQGGGASNPRLLKGRHGNGVADYIQDALDLVAFAKGDVNSSDANEAYWAGIRKAMGHEEPFEMTYLGIGNEQWGSTYYDCYQQFIVAFKEAAQSNPSLYGDIQLIVGNGTQLSNCEGYPGGDGGLALTAAKQYRKTGNITNLSEYGVHDHHYYRNYTEFLQYHTLYDSYSREEATKYYVFVGEYSANESKRLDGVTAPQENNSWLTALSEAAYMTGLERNGDIVKLAAYAPMFAAYDYSNQWAADMMYYNNTSISFTPNYYVQQIYMQNMGSQYIPSDVTVKDGFEQQFTVAPQYSVDKLYRSFTLDEKTGDIIVKIVNACEEDIDVNVELWLGDKNLTGTASLTTLQCDKLSQTSSMKEAAVSPETATIGVDKTFGYTAKKYSVSVIRVHVK